MYHYRLFIGFVVDQHLKIPFALLYRHLSSMATPSSHRSTGCLSRYSLNPSPICVLCASKGSLVACRRQSHAPGVISGACRRLKEIVLVLPEIWSIFVLCRCEKHTRWADFFVKCCQSCSVSWLEKIGISKSGGCRRIG